MRLSKGKFGICIDQSLGENTHLELELSRNRYFWKWFSFEIDWTRNVDHAGPSLEMSLLGFQMLFRIYDTRHWFYEEKRFFKDGEEYERYTRSND